MPRSEPDERQVEVECIRCGTTFEATEIVVNGMQPIRPKVCEACVEKDRAETEPRVPEPRDRLFQALHNLGVNVRKHGRCSLLPEPGAVPFDAAESRTPLDAALEFVEATLGAGRWDPVRGVIYVGERGTGKTHLAVGVLRSLILAGVDPGTIIFDRANELASTVRDTYGTGQTTALLERRRAATIWVLDDLGTEDAKPDVLRVLYDLLDSREAHPNVITTNFMPEELGQRFGDPQAWSRVSSRLASQNYRMVRVKGRDRRFLPPTAA